jgi:DNA repair protein RecO (recombination protein O)
MTSVHARRAQLTPGYILHHQPYRDTSRILEVLTRDFGKLSLFARGVRGPKAKFTAQLQPFQMLLLSWSGRGEAPMLTGAETAGNVALLPPANLMAGFYLNELLLKLTTRHDPLPAVFDIYHGTVETLKQGAALEPSLRIFEKRLLEMLGYGLDLMTDAQTGGGIDPGAHYLFRLTHGMFRTAADAPGAVEGRSVIALEQERLAEPRELEDARRILQSALAHVLEGRELNTRAVARSIARTEARP